jgi:hypothetical protein
MKTLALTLLASTLLLTGCSLRGFATTAGEVETIVHGTGYIKTGVKVYDYVRPTK